MKLKNNATYDEKIEYYFNKFDCIKNNETIKCFEHITKCANGKMINYKSFFDIIKTMMNTEYPLPLSDRYIKFKSINKQIRTLEKYQLRFGIEDGTKRFDEYRRKQAITNTFEYKKEKYGWSEEDYKKYNYSRAVTLENMIIKYGKEDGTKKYREYCDKQAYVGCKKEYFIEKYGEQEGLIRYKELLHKKMKPIINLMGQGYSKKEIKVIEALSSNDCVFYVSEIVKNEEIVQSYQYDVYDKDNDTYYVYDGCILDKKIFLEFNGDLWHNNKRNEHVQSLMESKSQLASDIKNRLWRDKLKIKNANNVGFDVYVIWEMDWDKHSSEIIEHFHQWMNNHNGNYSTEEIYGNENY